MTELLTEPPVYSVLPSNTLVYAIGKLLASKSRPPCIVVTLTFSSQCPSIVRDGR